MVKISYDKPAYLRYIPHIWSFILFCCVFLNLLQSNSDWGTKEFVFIFIIWIVGLIILVELTQSILDAVYIGPDFLLFMNKDQEVKLRFEEIRDIRFTMKLNFLARCVIYSRIETKFGKKLVFLPISVFVGEMPDTFQNIFNDIKKKQQW